VIIKVDSKYYRPAEVNTLLGDSSLATQRIGWNSKIDIDDMIKEMILYDIDNVK
jgi:GDPmannose 4,6-dehydratase